MITSDGLDIVELIFLCAYVIIVFLVTIIYMLVQTIKRYFRKKRGEKRMKKKELIKALSEEQKVGWCIAHGMYADRFWCSCGYIHVMDSNTIEWKYCPVCGATELKEKR